MLSARARRNLWIAGMVLVLFTVTGFFVLPPIVKSQLEKQASAQLGRTVTVGQVRVNPYTLSLTLEDFDIRLKEGNGSFMGWKRLYVNFDALASLTGDWVLSEIELEGFHAAVIVKPDGSLNFSDILAKLTAAAPPAAPPAKAGRPIRIGSLKVAEARVEFSDQSRKKPFATVVGPLTFNITEFRTAGNRGAPYRFEAVTEAGEKLAWSGTLAAEPVSSAGEFRLENIILPKYLAYYVDQIQAERIEGRLSVRGRYELNLASPRVMKLSDGVVQLRDAKIWGPGESGAAVELPSLDVAGIQADAMAMKATVTRVALTGGHARVRREQDGSINLLKLLQPSSPAPVASGAPAPGTATMKPPEVQVADIAVKDFQVDVADLAAPRPAQLGLTGLQVSLKNFTLNDGAVMPVQLSLEWAPKGTVRVEGSVSLKPEIKADLKTEVTALEILPLSPYVEQFINARVTQGAVSTAGAVQVAMAGGQPAITFEGGVTMEKFGLVDGAHNEELAGFGSLALTGLKVSTAPQLTVSLAEVNVTGPYARVLVNQDKTLNLAAVAKTVAPAAEVVGGASPSAIGSATAERPASPVAAESSGPKAPPTATPVPPAVAPAPKIEIGKVVITGGDFSLNDRSVEPNVRMAIGQFGGTIAGLSSENLARADVDLKGVVDGAGPVAITGKLDPLGASKFVDVKIDLKNMDLLPLSPYSGRYAGYELARGKLVLDVKFQLDGKKIESTNVVTLHQFTFGAPVTSPDATGLPVRLGVALLKDSSGQIVIDLPIQGSTDDPNFRIGKVVLRVIVNLLTKVATSPFALLGSMFGGGGEELAFQEFTPGAAALLPAETPKLATMVKALNNRPGLSLALEGGYDGPADTFALKRQKVADTVRRAIWEAKRATDPNIPPPDQLAISPEENGAMLRKLYEAKFPPGTAFGAPLAKAPVAAAPPPAPKRGFFGRVVDVFTFRGAGGGAAKPADAAKASPADTALPAGPSVEEMTGRLAETMEVGDNDLRALAAARAQAVRDYLATTGGIAGERLFLAKLPENATTAGKGPRVFLSLQ